MNKIVTRSSIAIIFLCFCIGVYKCGELHWNWYKKKFAAVETKPKIVSNGFFLLFCFGREIAKKHSLFLKNMFLNRRACTFFISSFDFLLFSIKSFWLILTRLFRCARFYHNKRRSKWLKPPNSLIICIFD